MSSVDELVRPIRPLRVPLTASLAVLWGGLAIAVICCCLRFLARVQTFKKLLTDDYFVALALLFAMANAITWHILAEDMYYIMNVAAGLQWPGAGFASTTERWSRASVAFTFFYYSSLWSIKIAFLLFFKRLGTNVMHQKKIWWTIFVFTIATYFVCIGITEYACRVRSFEYIVANCRKPRKTFASRLTIQLNCAWDVLTDFLIMIIPIRMLWGVQMKWRRKLALAGIFSLVIITISTSIIRASVVSSEAPRVIDTSWLYMWSAIEISVAIVVACLASFRNLFSRQTSRQNPKRYEPSDRSNLFLQGGKSRRRIRTLIDVLVSTSDDPHSSDQVHIEDGMNTRNSDHDTHDQIQLQKAVHVRKDIHLVDDVV